MPRISYSRKVKRTYRSKRARPVPARRRMAKRRYVPRKNRPSVSIQRGQFSADTQMVKLVYADSYTLTTGAGMAFQTMSGNSLFDPDTTGVGHQPRGYDQFSALYANYVVFSSSITVQFVSSSDIPIVTALIPLNNNAAGSFGTAIQTSEIKYAKTTTSTKTGRGAIWMKHYMSSARMFGVPPVQISTQYNYQGASGNTGVGTNPATQWRWIVGAQAVDLVTSVPVYARVIVTYYGKFWNRIVPTQS